MQNSKSNIKQSTKNKPAVSSAQYANQSSSQSSNPNPNKSANQNLDPISIRSLYDSHVHLLFTGERASMFDMSRMKSIEDLAVLGKALAEWTQKKDFSQEISKYFRGEIFMGFGWSFTPPSREQLQEIFSDHPIFLTRRDAHASLVNSKALEILKLPPLKAGLLQEQDHFQAYNQWPKLNREGLQRQLLCAQGVFFKAGFTHIRDMTMTEEAWVELKGLSLSKQFRLATEAYVHVASYEDLDLQIASALRMRKVQCKNLRLRGLKFFYDGTLGANTALLSCSCNSQKRAWSREHLKEAFCKAWQENLEVAVHCIGDLAVDEVIDLARELSAEGHLGRLCLEHAEVVKPETIQKMKPLHVEIHMQPCHFFSDREFLKERLGQDIQHAFPWSRFEKAKIPIYFGSDSPIETPNFFSNKDAITEVRRELGIESVRGAIEQFHSHPDPEWEPAITIFENRVVKEIKYEYA